MRPSARRQRIVVIGGGILGVSLARELALRGDADIVVVEKENALALHQTGRNSGVVHAGLYYPPGSLKARLCRRGSLLMRDFCAGHGLAYDECGKLLVALDGEEERRLHDIHGRAVANGVPGVRLLGGPELSSVEPHVHGIAGLHSPATAIVDYRAVTEALAAHAIRAGAVVHTGFPVTAVQVRGSDVVVSGPAGELRADRLVVCAGLQADRLARLAGDDRDPEIVPFRGEYYALRPEATRLVRGLIYPVPDPRYPFLGVHLTRRVDGGVLAGPNAVLALAREGYGWTDISARDLARTLSRPGFQRLARAHWRTGAQEVLQSVSRRRFAAAARRYVPELRSDDLAVKAPSGVRAQAVDPDGGLVDDFRIGRRGPVVAVRNAPSPAATSALAIAEHLAELVAGPD